VITVGMEALHLLPWHRPAATLVYSAKGRDVRHVWVDGHHLVRDGRLVEWSVHDVRAEVDRVWRRLAGAP
jgi:5-methylthioadenosine/S-adenosylhomocysteine deaminase